MVNECPRRFCVYSFNYISPSHLHPPLMNLKMPHCASSPTTGFSPGLANVFVYGCCTAQERFRALCAAVGRSHIGVHNNNDYNTNNL